MNPPITPPMPTDFAPWKPNRGPATAMTTPSRIAITASTSTQAAIVLPNDDSPCTPGALKSGLIGGMCKPFAAEVGVGDGVGDGVGVGVGSIVLIPLVSVSRPERCRSTCWGGCVERIGDSGERQRSGGGSPR